MIEVRYSRKEIWGRFIAMIPLVLISLWIGHFITDSRLFSPSTLMVVAAIFMIAAVRIALSDGVAFLAERGALTISGVWSKRRFAWSDVTDIDLVTVTKTSHGKPMPGGGTVYLQFTVSRKTLGKKEIRLNWGILDLSPDEKVNLVGNIRKVKQGAAPDPADYYADAPRSDGFDPDAIMARYMRDREKAGAGEPKPVVKPSFGRKGT